MATRRWGISRGESSLVVTEAVGAAVSSDSMELTVDLDAGMTQFEVFEALEKLKEHITNKNTWPPA